VEEYKKDFNSWNVVKQKLDNRERDITFQEGEIWWCSVGVNIGSEHDGKGNMFLRPIYVLKKINSKVFIGLPLTSRLKHDYAHVAFYFDYDLQSVVLSQIKVFDKKRLLQRIGRTSDYLQKKMKKATIAFLTG
jgi:mRNA interferase MazF